MTVLHLNSGNLFGGIEVNLLTLFRSRDLCPEMVPAVGVCFDAKPAEEYRKTGVPVYVFGGVRFSRPWTILPARRALARVLAEVKYDVVICHENWVHAIFAPVIRAARAKLVFWSHDRHPGSGWLDWLAHRTRPDAQVINSHYSAQQLLFPDVPTEVIYCPVAPPAPPSESRSVVRQRFETPPDAVVILQVGRWEAHKGHLALMAALGRLKDLPGWVCWQVGGAQRPEEHAYLDQVKAAARDAGIADRVRFTGWVPDVESVRCAADIFCQANMNPEPFGLTYVEALYDRLPVIAANDAGPKEIVTPDVGILVRPGDAPELADALAGLIRDPARRQALGAAGPKRAVKLCDPTQQLHRLTKLLHGESRT